MRGKKAKAQPLPVLLGGVGKSMPGKLTPVISVTAPGQLLTNRAGAISGNGSGTSIGPLAQLATNTARRLAYYGNPDPQFTNPTMPDAPANGAPSASSITDFSGTFYDAARKRILLMGGGHGPSEETDIRSFDLTTLQWSSLYTSTAIASMTVGNFDLAKGRWIDTNQPTARHTYRLTKVVGNKFYCLQPRGMPDPTLTFQNNAPANGNDQPGWGGRTCVYDFAAGVWNYLSLGSFGMSPGAPWYFAAQAAVDPVSQKILVAGSNAGAGTGNMWLYDPATDTVQTGPSTDLAYSGDIVYFPPNDKFYGFLTVFAGGPFVYEFTVNRSNFALSTVRVVSTSGTPPPQNGNGIGFAYDSVNHLIGTVQAGFAYAFDPLTGLWAKKTIQLESGSSGLPDVNYQCCEFDPDSGCYIFLSQATNIYDVTTSATWAYCWNRPGSSSNVNDLSITLDFGSGNLATFTGTGATDKGDFVGEFVRQKSYLATNPSFPDWRVWFRVDADSSGNRIVAPATGWRDEVIVEYGRSTGGTPTPWSTSYVATVKKSGTTVYSATVPNHNWYARWRYQSSQRPVVRAPATLIARGWIPHFTTTGMFGFGADTIDVTWAGPCQSPAQISTNINSTFNPSMAVGGDHDELGYLTEQAASYMIFGAAQNLRTVRTQGEWCGNWPMHIRDDTTGDMLSCRDLTTFFKDQPGGTINVDPVGRFSPTPNWVYIESAHWYACANAPWMLTDDPFFLEEFQFGVNWRILWNYNPRLHEQLGGIFYPGEIRSYAWGLRDLFQLTASCPAVTPTWLKPKSYWQACVDDNKTFALRFVNSPARVHALFRSWPISVGDASWQNSWLSGSVGHALAQGFSDWSAIATWSFGKEIAMSNGASGWNRQWPSPYATNLDRSNTLDPTRYYAWSDTTPDSVTCTDWADYWAYYKAGGGGKSDQDGFTFSDAGWDGHTLMFPQYIALGGGAYPFAGYLSYLLHVRSSLAIAARNGIANAQACYDYIHPEIANVVPIYTNGGSGWPQCRFSIEP